MRENDLILPFIYDSAKGITAIQFLKRRGNLEDSARQFFLGFSSSALSIASISRYISHTHLQLSISYRLLDCGICLSLVVAEPLMVVRRLD